MDKIFLLKRDPQKREHVSMQEYKLRILAARDELEAVLLTHSESLERVLLMDSLIQILRGLKPEAMLLLGTTECSSCGVENSMSRIDCWNCGNMLPT